MWASINRALWKLSLVIELTFHVIKFKRFCWKFWPGLGWISCDRMINSKGSQEAVFPWIEEQKIWKTKRQIVWLEEVVEKENMIIIWKNWPIRQRCEDKQRIIFQEERNSMIVNRQEKTIISGSSKTKKIKKTVLQFFQVFHKGKFWALFCS